MSPVEARYAARRGSAESNRPKSCTRTAKHPVFRRAAARLRFALRGLRKRPGFAMVAILTLDWGSVYHGGLQRGSTAFFSGAFPIPMTIVWSVLVIRLHSKRMSSCSVRITSTGRKRRLRSSGKLHLSPGGGLRSHRAEPRPVKVCPRRSDIPADVGIRPFLGRISRTTKTAEGAARRAGFLRTVAFPLRQRSQSSGRQFHLWKPCVVFSRNNSKCQTSATRTFLFRRRLNGSTVAGPNARLVILRTFARSNRHNHQASSGRDGAALPAVS